MNSTAITIADDAKSRAGQAARRGHRNGIDPAREEYGKARGNETRPGEPEVCDGCGRVRQAHLPWWTKDDVFGYCDRCRQEMGGEDWRPAREVARCSLPLAGKGKRRQRCREGDTQKSLGLALSEFISEHGLADPPRRKGRPAARGEGPVDTTGLVINFKPMEEQVMPKRGQPWSEEAKRRRRESLARKREAQGAVPPPAEGREASGEGRADQPARRGGRRPRLALPAPAAPAGEARYAIGEILGLLAELRAIDALRAMSIEDRKALCAMI